MSVAGASKCVTGAPETASCADSWYTGDSVCSPEGAVCVDGVTETCVSELTLDGPNETDADESALEIVPPSVGETICGGERPLPVFVVGSGGVPSVPAGVVWVSPFDVVVALPPTRTVIVPVPEPAVAAVLPVPVAGSVVPLVTVVSLPPCVVVGGVEPVDVSCGSVTDCDVSVVEPVVVPPVFDVSVVVAAGGSGVVGVMLFTFGSGAAFVSAGGTVVVLVPLPVLVSLVVFVFVLEVWLLLEDDCVLVELELELDDVELGCGSVRLCCSWASAAATWASTSDDAGTCCVVC